MLEVGARTRGSWLEGDEESEEGWIEGRPRAGGWIGRGDRAGRRRRWMDWIGQDEAGDRTRKEGEGIWNEEEGERGAPRGYIVAPPSNSYGYVKVIKHYSLIA